MITPQTTVKDEDASFVSVTSLGSSPIRNTHVINSKSTMRRLSSHTSAADDGAEEKTFSFISHNQETFTDGISFDQSNTSMSINSRKRRRKTTKEELKVLLQIFQTESTPNRQMREEIAARVNMTEKEVQVWFQNKRQAMKKVMNKKTKKSPNGLASPDSSTVNDNCSSESDISNETISDFDLGLDNHMFKFKAAGDGQLLPAMKRRKKSNSGNNTTTINRIPLQDITNRHNKQ